MGLSGKKGRENKTKRKREWKEDNTVNELEETRRQWDQQMENVNAFSPLLSFISKISLLSFLPRTHDGQIEQTSSVSPGTQTDSLIQREQASLYSAKQQVLCHVSQPFINSPSHTKTIHSALCPLG